MTIDFGIRRRFSEPGQCSKGRRRAGAITDGKAGYGYEFNSLCSGTDK